ncbi:HAD family hydrolase [Agrobacterium tumefaciens]|uniref:HAD family hydrolase n=1 Tax=Agrobacterium tumefaciens TaxID=358 RepID=UPI003BB98BE8
MASHYILWDFEGTLARRRGRFAEALRTSAMSVDPNFETSSDDLKPYLSAVLPWNSPDRDHHFATQEAWWAPLRSASMQALLAHGLRFDLAEQASENLRMTYLNLAYWDLLPHAAETLQRLSVRGWRHAILSNFAPDLQQIVEGLGIAGSFDRIFSSGSLGHEKPSPESFSRVVAELAPAQVVWMIGDNVKSDIEGGKAAGLSTILIGKEQSYEGLSVTQLGEVPDLIGQPKLTSQ